MTARDVIAGLVAEMRAEVANGDGEHATGWEIGRWADRLESILAQPGGEAVAHEVDEAALEAAVEAGRAAIAPTRGPAPGFAQMRAGIRAYMAAYTTPPAPLGGLTEGRFVYEMLALAIEHGDKHGWPTARVTLTNLREGDTLRRLTAPRAEGVDAVTTGVVRFMRSEGAKVCVCCPGEPNHIYSRGVEWDGKTAADLIYDFIRNREGERITVTLTAAAPKGDDL